MSKKFALCTAAALVATGLFAQAPVKSQSQSQNPCACLEQGMGLPTEKKCFPAAYNAPASIAVSCGWDFNLFASFIYWHVSQDKMEVAQVAPSATTTTATPGQVAYQDFKYKPGFKVGVGFNTNYDDWTGWVEYTWLHQSTSTSNQAVTGTLWTPADWFVLTTATPASVVNSSWKMNLDMLDAAFSRPYYQGTQLTLSPFAGLRALWIRERNHVGLVNATLDYATEKSHCWSIGSVAGCVGHWMVGMGFRFEGKVDGALLYTKYTSIGNKVKIGANLAVSSKTEYSALRPMAEMGVGLGWGSYLYCQKYYIDFSARYDFALLWEQNVMRSFSGQLNGISEATGDLALHGLTLNARFDF